MLVLIFITAFSSSSQRSCCHTVLCITGLSRRCFPSDSIGTKRKSSGDKKKGDKKANGGELFSGDGTGKDKAGDGAKAGPKLRKGQRVDSGGLVKNLSKQELNKLKRGGKGKRTFKSKSKFKRRK